MAFFMYSNITRELIDVSDIQISPLDDCAVSEISGITRAELISKYTWDSDGCQFIIPVTKKLSKREFLKKLTPIEYASIKTAANTNAIVDYYWQLFMVADYIDLTDPDVLNGLLALESINLLASGRAQEIIQ